MSNTFGILNEMVEDEECGNLKTMGYTETKQVNDNGKHEYTESKVVFVS